MGGDSDSRMWVPAATVALVRDGSSGVEVLMARRAANVEFANTWVFPGGKVDPEDWPVSAVPTQPTSAQPQTPDTALVYRPDEAIDAARNAAVREAAEEVGAVLDPDRLVPLAHWTAPEEVARAYVTWVFVALCPSGPMEVDGRELTEMAWLPPETGLAGPDNASMSLTPPTWMALHDLAEAATAAGVIENAASKPIKYFATRVARGHGRLLSLWDGDAGYWDRDVDRPGPRNRLWMDGGPWRLEVSDTSS